MQQIYRIKIGSTNHWASFTELDDGSVFWNAGTGVRKMDTHMSGVISDEARDSMIHNLIARGYVEASK